MDQDQINQLQRGLSTDVDGNFERVMLAYQHRLFSFALRMSGNPEDAEEIVQDAFVRAYRALQGYATERIAGLALRPWLYQITLNVFRNRVRGKRLSTISLDVRLDEQGDWEPADPERDRPEKFAERSELRDELAALLTGLPEQYRAAVILRHVEGLSYGELAEVLCQPVGTAKANVHRGLALLRSRMPAATPVPA
jgi:RNA polymerase sigma-70 factor (ECF subfamily)